STFIEMMGTTMQHEKMIRCAQSELAGRNSPPANPIGCNGSPLAPLRWRDGEMGSIRGDRQMGRQLKNFILLSAFCLLPFAFCLLPFAFSLI
ncbi:hypothetical protein, partial [Floridanema aerugineum]